MKEPVWRELKQWPLHSLPSQVSDWLLEPGSLTRRMKESFQAPFGVQLIEQGLAKPTLAD
ncbi:MAG TPA: hypothetical protein DCL50_00030, partial [Methylococcaceae bacterium]|nr:hypothetical protein [Methylococcaceae bacterium]